ERGRVRGDSDRAQRSHHAAHRRVLRGRLALARVASEASESDDEVGVGEVAERAMTKAVFLDRDGTIIDVVRDEETGAIGVAFHPAQLRLLSGAIEGMKMLRDAGYTLAIATNQPAPAKGQFSADAVKRTNDALVAMLAAEGIAISEVAVCMHHPQG